MSFIFGLIELAALVLAGFAVWINYRDRIDRDEPSIYVKRGTEGPVRNVGRGPALDIRVHCRHASVHFHVPHRERSFEISEGEKVKGHHWRGPYEVPVLEADGATDATPLIGLVEPAIQDVAREEASRERPLVRAHVVLDLLLEYSDRSRAVDYEQALQVHGVATYEWNEEQGDFGVLEDVVLKTFTIVEIDRSRRKTTAYLLGVWGSFRRYRLKR